MYLSAPFPPPELFQFTRDFEKPCCVFNQNYLGKKTLVQPIVNNLSSLPTCSTITAHQGAHALGNTDIN